MKQRIISGAIMTLIVIPFILLGGKFLNVGVSLLSILAYKELMDLNENKDIDFFIKVIGILCILFLVNYQNPTNNSLLVLPVSIITCITLALFIPIVCDVKNYGTNKAFKMLSIVLFLGINFNLIISTYQYNLKYLLLLIIISTSTDIFALFGGKLFGRHHFSKISPNKTIEGCISGIVMAIIFSSVYYYFVISKNITIMFILFICLLSIIGQIGDLFFSKIKRENSIKDFSNLIPGHGGILDRLDSTIFILLAYSTIFKFI